MVHCFGDQGSSLDWLSAILEAVTHIPLWSPGTWLVISYPELVHLGFRSHDFLLTMQDLVEKSTC